MKSLRLTTCMLSTVEYQSTIAGMLDERRTKCANSDGAMGFEIEGTGLNNGIHWVTSKMSA